ncbi:uncharacterized protein A1O5_01489 [Cladophialophora psammophila CBS 110553]|uniref:Uncharacterized protein n=1 Tax=Cladophialophora psammophila CBS 110553 TaxID=1182543 RepID=W9X3L3_9EURO|nr:uncharacterized protein A1O5_01489 [Cladophialophora psammophila CBS 110553]EXJ74793.1 hypothetical protein A1O5_01489 [Cladophialophora psammophila CBS 110553]
MDPLTISTSAVALITVCIQIVQVIKKTVETMKTAKSELMNILNETIKMRLLLEQLRGLTHQLGSQNNTILLAFDETGCKYVLNELESLVNKLAQADKFLGFQFWVRRSKLDTLVAGLRVQEDGIRTVLLSVTTETALFTREDVKHLIAAANVQAIAISSIAHGGVDTANDLPPPFSEQAELPIRPAEPIQKAGATVDRLPTAYPGSVKVEVTPESQTQAHTQDTDDLISLVETEPPPTATTGYPAGVGTNAKLLSTLEKENSTMWLPISKLTPLQTKIKIDTPLNTAAISKILSRSPIWHGQLSRDLYDQQYLRMRDRLADAAYWGNWAKVEATIDEAHAHGLRSWPNCYRLGRLPSPSGWTPLHQAAFLSAPEHVVRKLVDQGASLTLQTLWASSAELPFRNMTALEMARFLGFKHLFDVLSPVLHHLVPHTTLDKLQQHFHRLIQVDLAGRPEAAHLRLPALELLTELRNPEMYFALKSPKIAMVITPSLLCK